MKKSVKILLGISAVLLVIFIAVLFNDYRQFHNNLSLVTDSLKSSDPAKLQAFWFTVIVVRATEFLVPALLLGGGALIVHVQENRRPKSSRKK